MRKSWDLLVLIVEGVLIYFIIISTQNVSTSNKCNFTRMPDTSFLVFVTYLFNMIQQLIDTLETRTYTNDTITSKVRLIVPPWIMIYKRVGYNWVVVLRNLIVHVIIGTCRLVGLEHLATAFSNLSDLSLVILLGMRLASLYSFLLGDRVCTGALPSFITDLIASSIPVYKILQRWTQSKKKST